MVHFVQDDSRMLLPLLHLLRGHCQNCYESHQSPCQCHQMVHEANTLLAAVLLLLCKILLKLSEGAIIFVSQVTPSPSIEGTTVSHG
jgi:hypothetical protein